MRVTHIAVAIGVIALLGGEPGAGRAQEVIKPIGELVYPANISNAPFKWAGRLVIPNPAQAGYFILCTAQFITPNVLLTAAHCLKNPTENPNGPWPDPSKGQFQLQYSQGKATQTFSIICGSTNPLWTFPANFGSLSRSQQVAAQNKAYPHDFAMLLVNGQSPTGYMPYALDWKGKYKRATRIGYPGDLLSGEILVEAPGIVFPADAIPLPKGDDQPNLVVQWGPVTEATEGMSGGAWVESDNSNNNLIAVTSFNTNLIIPNNQAEVPDFPGGTWAAYLTAAEFNPLLSFVSGGCKGPGTQATIVTPPPGPAGGDGGGGLIAPNSK